MRVALSLALVAAAFLSPALGVLPTSCLTATGATDPHASPWETNSTLLQCVALLCVPLLPLARARPALPRPARAPNPPPPAPPPPSPAAASMTTQNPLWTRRC